MICLVPDCNCVTVKFLEERNTLLNYECKTGFGTKILDPSSVRKKFLSKEISLFEVFQRFAANLKGICI